MIFSNAKTFNEKMRRQFVKIWQKKEKKSGQFFKTFNH